jgi:hypothetical protein
VKALAVVAYPGIRLCDPPPAHCSACTVISILLLLVVSPISSPHALSESSHPLIQQLHRYPLARHGTSSAMAIAVDFS